MKKKKFILISCFILAGITSIFSQYIHRVNADGTMDYTTISAAVANASSGDVIDIYGTITGDGIPVHGIIISKNLVIQGQGADVSIIQSSTKEADENVNQRIFTVTPGTTVILQNLTVRNGYLHGEDMSETGAGIKNYGFLVMTKCKMYGNYSKMDDHMVEAGILNHGGGYTSLDETEINQHGRSMTKSENIR
jgi:hypothetical protein